MGPRRSLGAGIALALLVHVAGCGTDETPRPVYEFVVQDNLVYAKPGNVKLALDVYQPQGDGPFSGVLVVHGGGWKEGDRRQLQVYAEKLARRGHCCFAISYRLAPRYIFPAQIEDCRAAVIWIREHAGEYNVDPSRLGAIGYSAGGQLVSLLGTSGEAPSTENGGVDTRLQAVVAGGAPCEFRYLEENGKGLEYWLGGGLRQRKANYENASPTLFVSSDDPPTCFFNGTDDEIVPWSWTSPLYDQLQAAGVEVMRYDVEGAGHMDAMFDEGAIEAACDFLDKHLAGSGAADD